MCLLLYVVNVSARVVNVSARVVSHNRPILHIKWTAKTGNADSERGIILEIDICPLMWATVKKEFCSVWVLILIFLSGKAVGTMQPFIFESYFP